MPSYINLQIFYLAAYVLLIPAYIIFMALILSGSGSGMMIGGLLVIAVLLVVMLGLSAETMVIEAGLYKFWILGQKDTTGKIGLKASKPKPVSRKK